MSVPAVEVGGSHVMAAEVDLERGTLGQGKCIALPLDPRASANELLGTIGRCARGLGASASSRWGVALPGPFDYERGVGLYRGVGKFESLYGVDVRSALAKALPGPPASITFVNDAEAFMWGERLFGAAAGWRRCVSATLGTGVGSAFFAQGAVQRCGPGVPPEGRLDLLTIAGEPLEETVSTRAIVREFARRSGSVGQSTLKGVAEVAAAARAGDSAAQLVLRSAFYNLGVALGPWLEEFGADALVVGGAMAGAWDLISPPLERGISKACARPICALLAARPREAALLGAAAVAEGARTGQ
jgi:glucokinase